MRYNFNANKVQNFKIISSYYFTDPRNRIVESYFSPNWTRLFH